MYACFLNSHWFKVECIFFNMATEYLVLVCLYGKENKRNIENKTTVVTGAVSVAGKKIDPSLRLQLQPDFS